MYYGNEKKVNASIPTEFRSNYNFKADSLSIDEIYIIKNAGLYDSSGNPIKHVFLFVNQNAYNYQVLNLRWDIYTDTSKSSQKINLNIIYVLLGAALVILFIWILIIIIKIRTQRLAF